MKTFTVDGKKISAKVLTFNDVVKLEDYGINLMELGDITKTKVFSLVRGYIAICTGETPDFVGENYADINFNEVLECFSWSVENSGFFRAINKGAEKETPTVQKSSK